MPDDNAAASAAGDATAALAPAAAPLPNTPSQDAPASPQAAPKPDASLLSGADDGGEPLQSTATWPDDWRERFAGTDEQALKELKRWADPANVYKSWKEIRKKQSAGLLAPSLPDGASEEEVAAYRKSAGIPEKPEEYGLAFPEGIEATETHKAQLGAWAEAAHAMNMPPGMAKGAFDAYLRIQQAEGQRAYEEARKATEDARVEIRSEYGRDFQRNVAVGNQFLMTHAGGEEKANELAGVRLADGRLLGDHPDFVRLIVSAGLATTGDDQLIAVESAGAGKTLDEQIREEMDLLHTDQREYDKPEREQRRLRLFEARRQRETRQGMAA